MCWPRRIATGVKDGQLGHPRHCRGIDIGLSGAKFAGIFECGMPLGLKVARDSDATRLDSA